MRKTLIVGALAWITVQALQALQGCDLCAVYSASTARDASGRGFVLTTSELFVPHDRTQFEGREVRLANPDRWDSYTTHLVPGFNFSSRLGVSLNLPWVYQSFRRTDLVDSTTAPPGLVMEEGVESGLGDAALIGRFTVFRKREMEYGVTVNLLGGVKFPTGGTDLITAEIEQGRIYDTLVPPGRPHDPLGHSISGVHLHELSPGSGSFDGVSGLASKAYLGRWFLDAQFQYYLRTEGESGLRMGDEWMLSGGPGWYLWMSERGTLTLQASAAYESEAMDTLLGRESARTGMVAWYLGPQINLTLGEHFLANAGVDMPLKIDNNGFRNVPDYRLHGGVTWRF